MIRTSGAASKGPREMVIFGYDADSGAFTRFNVNSAGYQAFARGKLDGTTWRWRGDGPQGGETIHFVGTQSSPDSYTYRVGTGADGPGKVVAEGTATRVK